MSDADKTSGSRSRALHRLTARKVETLTAPGAYMDGGGLLLRLGDGGTKKWLFRFKSPSTGKRREMGLGRADKGTGFVSLADARAKADSARQQLARDLDPLDEAEREAAARTAEAQKKAPKTFGAVSDAWLDENDMRFRNEKHRAQWRMTMREYAGPLRGKLPGEITTDDILSILKPLWQSKPETAKRTQGRIERILDAASAQGLFDSRNPARWRGHLDKLLPSRRKLSRGHHAALPHADLPSFMVALRDQSAVAAQALEFLILTAARSGEVRNMTWGELDADRTRWTVPAKRMKAGREHRVPLTNRARAILAEVGRLRRNDDDPAELVFPGQRRHADGSAKPMSDMTLAAVLRRMKMKEPGGQGITVHGFRSTFRDWAGDRTNFARDIVEQALAHRVGDATEQAYRRGDALDRRAKLMTAWEAYAASGTAGANIVQMKRTPL